MTYETLSIDIDPSNKTSWEIIDSHVKITRRADHFQVESQTIPGTVLSWREQADPPWTLRMSEKLVCSMGGMAPPLDAHEFVHAKVDNPTHDYAHHDSPRSLSGLMALGALPQNELRRLVHLATGRADPFSAFCALSAGADIATPSTDRYDRHPVSAALDRICNEQGHARIKRTLPDTRAWLDFLGAFGASPHDREIDADGAPKPYPVGSSAAWGGDEARHAALERGVDFTHPLEIFFSRSADEPMFARALAMVGCIADSAAECGRLALRKASAPELDERDQSRAAGHDVISAPDLIAAALLEKGRVSAFATALKFEPRIDRQFAIERGIAQWLDANRFKACKGPKPALAFNRDFSEFRDSCQAAGIANSEFDRAVGLSLCRLCSGSTLAAYSDAEQSGGLAKIDISFLSADDVLLGARPKSNYITGARGAFEVDLLIRTGAPAKQISTLLNTRDPMAMRLLRLACEKEDAFALRDAMDLQLTSLNPGTGAPTKTRTL